MSGSRSFGGYDNDDSTSRRPGKSCGGLGQLLIQTGANDVIANRFITPGLSVDLTTNLPEQQDSNFPFHLNTLEGGGAAEDWMMMNSQGSFW